MLGDLLVESPNQNEQRLNGRLNDGTIEWNDGMERGLNGMIDTDFFLSLMFSYMFYHRLQQTKKTINSPRRQIRFYCRLQCVIIENESP